MNTKTNPIKSDSRYTVAKEFCGQPQARFVARFCGEWLGQSLSYPAAVLICTVHRCGRNGAEAIVAKTN